MKVFSLVSVSMALLSPLAALAQGGTGVKGGDAVVCFDRNIKGAPGQPQQHDYVNDDGVITSTGRAHAISAFSREHYQINTWVNRSHFLDNLIGLSYDAALDKIVGRFDDFPIFSETLRQYNRKLKSFAEGPRLVSVEDINDSGIDFTVETNCVKVQAVVRDINLFRTNVTATENLLKVGVNAAMMQAHELFYYFAVTHTKQTDSSHTEGLLIQSLAHDYTTEELSETMETLGFPGSSYTFNKNDPEKAVKVMLTRENIVGLAEKSLENFNERVNTISGWMTDGNFHNCDLRHPKGSPNNLPIDTEDFLPFNGNGYLPPKSLSAPASEVSRESGQVLSEMKIVGHPDMPNQYRCKFTGIPVTPEQKARVRAKMDEFDRIVRKRP